MSFSELATRAMRMAERATWVVILLVMLGATVPSPAAVAAPDDTLANLSEEYFGPDSPAAEERSATARPPYVIGGPLDSWEGSLQPGAGSFIPTALRPGDIDVSKVRIWYIPAEEAMVPALSDSQHTGRLADLLFSFFKYLLHGVVVLIGIVVFGLFFVRVLLDPALNMGEAFRAGILEPSGLLALALAAAGGYALWFWLGKRFKTAFIQFFIPVAIIVIASVVTPVGVARFLWSAGLNGGAVLMLVGTGQDPSGVAAPSTGTVDVSDAYLAYAGFVNALEMPMIGVVAQVITFGAPLPEECLPAWQAGMDSGAAPNSYEVWLPMVQAEGACFPFVQYGWETHADRVVFAALLTIYAILFVLVMLYLAKPALKAQFILLGLVAAYPFLVIAGVFPGTPRVWAFQFFMRCVMGFLAVLAFSIAIVFILVLMAAALEITSAYPASVGLLLALAIPFMVALVIAYRRKRSNPSPAKWAARIPGVGAPGALSEGGAYTEDPMGLTALTERAGSVKRKVVKTVGREALLMAGSAAVGGAAGAGAAAAGIGSRLVGAVKRSSVKDGSGPEGDPKKKAEGPAPEAPATSPQSPKEVPALPGSHPVGDGAREVVVGTRDVDGSMLDPGVVGERGHGGSEVVPVEPMIVGTDGSSAGDGAAREPVVVPVAGSGDEELDSDDRRDAPVASSGLHAERQQQLAAALRWWPESGSGDDAGATDVRRRRFVETVGSASDAGSPSVPAGVADSYFDRAGQRSGVSGPSSPSGGGGSTPVGGGSSSGGAPRSNGGGSGSLGSAPSAPRPAASSGGSKSGGGRGGSVRSVLKGRMGGGGGAGAPQGSPAPRSPRAPKSGK